MNDFGSNKPTESLSPEKLQMFVAGLSGLAPEEVRKAKVLYLRNAISELEALESSMRGFGVVQGCFAVIPFFWPFLYAQRRIMSAQVNLAKDRLRNAMDVWRDDLGGERFQIGDEELGP